MNFEQFISFATDYGIFPDLLTKSTLYRIFHSLSYINEVMNDTQKTDKSAS